MFDNVAFDVVIGLIFVYLLYSLFATIISELIATWLGMRARVLRMAIERMLNDGYTKEIPQSRWKFVNFFKRIYYKLTNSLKQFVLYEKEEFKQSFSGRFYNYPSIKYLSKLESEHKIIFSNTKPSYLTAENFAITLINLFSEKGEGKNTSEQVDFALRYNTYQLQPETLKQVRNIFKNAGNDINAFKSHLMKWFDESMDRATGWYKRKLKLILFWLGLIIAMTFNVDSIQIARILANDKEARNQLSQMAVAFSADSSRNNDFIKSNGDTIHSKALLDSGYARISKDIKDAKEVIGSGWNFEQLTKAKVCFYDAKKQAGIFHFIEDNLEEYEALRTGMNTVFNKIKDSTLRINKMTRFLKLANEDSLVLVIKQLVETNAEDKKKFDSAFTDLKKNRDSISKMLLLGLAERKKDSVLMTNLATSVKEINSVTDSLTANAFVEIDSLTIENANGDSLAAVYGKRTLNGFEKTWYIITASTGNMHKLLGLILTAFALSLGAPFWFDLLNKFVSMRGSGVKPEEKKLQEKSVKFPLTVNDNPENKSLKTPMPPFSNIEAMIKKLKAHYTDKRIISIEQGFIKRADKKEEAIEIHVADEEIKKQLHDEIGDAYESFPVNCIVTSHAETHSGECGNTIHNETKVNGFGTLGCFLNRINSGKKYMASCWHVLKGDFSYETNSGSGVIKDSEGVHIATETDGCLSTTIDIGFAEMQDAADVNNSIIAIKSQHRTVTREDAIDETSVHFIGARSGVCENAVIYNYSLTKNLDYPDNSKRKLEDLFSITVYKDGEPTSPSDKGDSGSVIVDKNGFPLGILLGGDAAFSYAAKFSNILSAGCLFEEYSIIV